MNTDTATPERLAGYTLVREAGRGAMSTVYEARDANDRRLAVKVLHAPATLAAEQQKALVDRLDREARVMLRLSHPNVVRLFDVGQQAGEHFIVMEFLDGQTLRARLDGGPLSLAEASRLLDQAAAALDAVHAAGIVHRDVKPSNIMLVGGGQVKLMDFGVARQGDDTTITQTGMIVGSPAYMSPEQVRGDENTASTDLWALGILLYEMLSGHSPFNGSNISNVLYRVAHEAPAPVPGLSNAVQQILRRALDKNPAKRYPTGHALAAAFRLAALGPARPRTTLPPRPRRLWLAAPVAALLALLVGTVLFTHTHSRSDAGPSPAPTPFYGSSGDATHTPPIRPRGGKVVTRGPRPGGPMERTTATGVPLPAPARRSVATALMRPPGPSSLAVPGQSVLTPGNPSATATIQEIVPTPPGKPKAVTRSHRAVVGKTKAVAGKPAHKPVPKKAARHKPASATYFPRRARSARAANQARLAARQHAQRARRMISVRRAYPNQRQRWQNIERFIYHGYY